jgi:2,3-bisphosphoglycerate-dependent phosphoglycerate mutase
MKRATKIHKVVLVRHGESTWNKENRFTGWHDVPLSQHGVEEAIEAGKLLREAGFNFDLCYTSVLQRAIKTYYTIADQLDLSWIPHHKHWRLNERHYGALQGLNKAETSAKHGEEQVLQWRRSFDIPPPELELDDERHPRFSAMYQNLPADALPKTESLKTTIDRVLPFWHDTVCPSILDHKQVIVVAHGNSLRAVVKHLSGMSEDEILNYNIPCAVPLVYEFDQDLNPLKNYFLLDEDEVKRRQEAVAK